MWSRIAAWRRLSSADGSGRRGYRAGQLPHPDRGSARTANQRKGAACILPPPLHAKRKSSERCSASVQPTNLIGRSACEGGGRMRAAPLRAHPGQSIFTQDGLPADNGNGGDSGGCRGEGACRFAYRAIGPAGDVVLFERGSDRECTLSRCRTEKRYSEVTARRKTTNFRSSALMFSRKGCAE